MRQQTSEGNTEGTSARVRASTRAYSSSADSSRLRDLRARGLPRMPSIPASLLDGKEGVDGSSPSEGFKKPQHISGFLSMLVVGSGDTRSHQGRTGLRTHVADGDPLSSEEDVRPTARGRRSCARNSEWA